MRSGKTEGGRLATLAFGDWLVAHPLNALLTKTRCWNRVMNLVSFAQPMHMTRAHTHNVPWQHFQASFIGGCFKIISTDGKCLVEEINSV